MIIITGLIRLWRPCLALVHFTTSKWIRSRREDQPVNYNSTTWFNIFIYYVINGVWHGIVCGNSTIQHQCNGVPSYTLWIIHNHNSMNDKYTFISSVKMYSFIRAIRFANWKYYHFFDERERWSPNAIDRWRLNKIIAAFALYTLKVKRFIDGEQESILNLNGVCCAPGYCWRANNVLSMHIQLAECSTAFTFFCRIRNPIDCPKKTTQIYIL